MIKAGTLDGTIGATQIHGALRTLDKPLGPGRENVDGTEFDAGGSRSFVINLHYMITNGRTIETGTGRWTGGTGAYTRAHGMFKDSKVGPVGGVHTFRINGSIKLRMILPHRTGEPITDRELPHVEPTTRRASDNVRGRDRPLASARGGRRQDERPARDLRDPQIITIGTRGKPGTASFRVIKAGTLDGTIGRTQIHGALRTLDTLHGPGSETDHGTEFDEGGSRSFVINLHYAITNGRTLDSRRRPTLRKGETPVGTDRRS